MVKMRPKKKYLGGLLSVKNYWDVIAIAVFVVFLGANAFLLSKYLVAGYVAKSRQVIE